MLYAGLPLRANIYTVAVGPSGDGQKSTAVGLGLNLLDRAAPLLVGDEPANREGLIDSMVRQPTQVLFYDELGTFIEQTKQGYAEALKSTFTKAWDAKPLQRARADKKGARDVVRVENPRLSIVAACSTSYMEKIDPAEWTSGFMGRWLLLYAKMERLVPRPPRIELSDYLREHLTIRSEVEEAGAFQDFDAVGGRLWDAWFVMHHKRNLPKLVQGLRSRAPTIALKIAMLYGWDYGRAAYGEPWWLTEELLYPALQLTELYIQSVLELADSMAPHEDARIQRSVLDLIPAYETGTYATLGELANLTKLRPQRLKEAIEGLTLSGRISRVGSSLGSETAYAQMPRPAAVTPAEDGSDGSK